MSHKLWLIIYESFSGINLDKLLRLTILDLSKNKIESVDNLYVGNISILNLAQNKISNLSKLSRLLGTCWHQCRPWATLYYYLLKAGDLTTRDRFGEFEFERKWNKWNWRSLFFKSASDAPIAWFKRKWNYSNSWL